MTLSNWDETTANGHRRVFRIEIDNPSSGPQVARYHLQRVFQDADGNELSQSPAGSWDLVVASALADPELGPHIQAAMPALEAIAQILYQREQAAASSRG